MKDYNIAVLIVAVLCFSIDALFSAYFPTNPQLQIVHQNSYLIIGACLAIFNGNKDKTNGPS